MAGKMRSEPPGAFFIRAGTAEGGSISRASLSKKLIKLTPVFFLWGAG